MRSYEVHYINKKDRNNPHEPITHIAGMNGLMCWKITQQRAIDGIENREFSLFVREPGLLGKIAWVIVARSPWGNKCIKTMADGKETNNLLLLPECPEGLLLAVPI